MRELLEFFGIVFGLIASVVLAIALPYALFGSVRVSDIDENAPAFLKTHGMEIIGREGYQAGIISMPGGCVWFTMRRASEPRTIYHGCVSKWHNGTYELWNLQAVNALRAN